MEGVVCGRYRITGKLGGCSLAKVYAAVHELGAQEAAVKLLRPEISAHRMLAERFMHEAQAAAAIKNPGIVDVYDVGYTADGHSYIVMERLRGESLGERLRRLGRLSASATGHLIRQLAGVVAAAHARGIVHGGIEPDSVVIVPDPEVPGGERLKVLDFGLATLALECAGWQIIDAGDIARFSLYMAPERWQAAARPVGQEAIPAEFRADLYSIGCILFHCLVGQPPSGPGEARAALAARLAQAPTPPCRVIPGVPAALDSLLLQLLDSSPTQRIQSCTQLIAALDTGVAGPRPRHAAQDIGAATRIRSRSILVNAPRDRPCRPSGERSHDRNNYWLLWSSIVLVVAGVTTAVLPSHHDSPRQAVAIAAAGTHGPRPHSSRDARAPEPGEHDAGPLQHLPGEPGSGRSADTMLARQNSSRVSRRLPGLMDAMKTAYSRERYSHALGLCRRVWEIDSTYPELALWCALSSCKLGKRSRVERYLGKVPPQRRGLVSQTCRKQGIEIGPVD